MKKNGFIIPLTLMFVSIAVVIVTYMYQKGIVFVPYQTTMIKREQARQLALGGVEIARAQLSLYEQEQAKEENKQDTPVLSLLKNILPKLNRWQRFDLKQQIDGVQGEMHLIIASEAGKININEVYDFTKKSFKGEWQKILQELFKRIQNKTAITTNLFDPFEKFLKERHAKLNDVTELLKIKQFKPLASAIFYQLPADKKEKKTLYLGDIFTVYGKKDKIQPWLFSEGIIQLLELKQPKVLSNEMIQNLIKNFKTTIQWNQDWKIIGKPRYGVELTQLPKGIEASFDTTFDPSIFSVVSYGKVGNITQKVYAILERSEQTVKKKKVINVAIKKLYWI